jgi:hypothetical protein
MRRRRGVADHAGRNIWLFAPSRLNDPAVLEWAISLDVSKSSERHALRNLIEAKEGEIRAGFKQAWEWVFEHWGRPEAENSLDRLMLKQQFKHQSNPRELVRLVADAVRPWLDVKKRSAVDSIFGSSKKTTPKSARDLFYASVSSGEILKPEDIGLSQVTDLNLLKELAATLTACVVSGLNLAASIREITARFDYTDSLVRRVYFVPPAQQPVGGGEPDVHGRGLAPSVKLLNAVVARISALDANAAKRIVFSWDVDTWRLFRRMWAAAARNETLASGEDVESFLLSLSSEEFWVYHSCPEIAELRAVRWSDLSPKARQAMERRLRRGRPRSLFSSNMKPDMMEAAVRRTAVVELLRIRSSSGELTERTNNWLSEQIGLLPTAPEVDSATFGFNPGVIVTHGTPDEASAPADEGIDPLAVMRSAIGADYWDDSSKVARAMVAKDPGATYSALIAGPLAMDEAAPIWEMMARFFRSSESEDQKGNKERFGPVAEAMCSSIATFPEETLVGALGALTAWLNQWAATIKPDTMLDGWLRLWPLATVETDRIEPTIDSFENDVHGSAVSDLIHALFRICPDNPKPGAFRKSPRFSKVLDEISKANGTSRLVIVYLMAQNIGYFYPVEPKWTMSNVIEPLREATDVALQTWAGLAFARSLPAEVMEFLGPGPVAVINGGALKDHSESNLVDLAFLSILSDRDLGQKRRIPDVLGQQMLRMGDDGVRAQAVDTMRQFLLDGGVAAVDRRFEVVKATFRDLWPKEHSLRSRRVSDALAALPAASKSHFAAMEAVISTHLTPFDCWSLWEYGVLGDDGDERAIKWVETKEDAEAFLDLLDRTVADDEAAVVPYGLDSALAHISLKFKKLESDPRYRRLLTLARR